MLTHLLGIHIQFMKVNVCKSIEIFRAILVDFEIHELITYFGVCQFCRMRLVSIDMAQPIAERLHCFDHK